LFVAALLTIPVGAEAANNEAKIEPPGKVRITLQDIVLKVLEDNLDIQAIGMASKMAATEILFEKGAFDPVLFGEAGYSNQDYPVSDVLTGMHTEKIQGKAGIRKKLLFGTEIEAGTEGNKLLTDAPVYFMRPEYRQKFYANIVQPLLRGAGVDANAARIRLAQAQAEQEAQKARGKLIDVLYDAIQAYWDLYRYNEKLDATMKGIRMAERLYLDNRVRVEEGMVPESDVLQAFAEVHRRLADVIRARQNAMNADKSLKRAVSMPPNSVLWDLTLVTAELPGLDPISLSEDDIMASARRFNPQIVASEAGVMGAEAEKKWAENYRKPKLDFEAGISVHGLSGDEKPGAAEQGYPVREDFKGGYGHGYSRIFNYPEWTVGLKFEMPIPGNQGRAKYEKASYGLAKARLEERASIIGTYAAVRNIVPRLMALQAEAKARQASIEYKQRQVDDEMYKLTNGLGTTYDALKMQTEYVDELYRYADASAEYMTALGELMKITGIVVLDTSNLGGFRYAKQIYD
jgi:outer membrane protein TolC